MVGPMLIFGARLLDVPIGTLRIVSIAQGRKPLAAFLGFFESLIWLIATCHLMQNLTDWTCYVAYAAGYAAGNYLGLCIEEWLALGTVVLTVNANGDTSILTQALREGDFGVTIFRAEGLAGERAVLSTVFPKQRLKEALLIVKNFSPAAFYTVEDIRVSQGGHIRNSCFRLASSY